jgi:hypothetical protein
MFKGMTISSGMILSRQKIIRALLKISANDEMRNSGPGLT